MNRPPLTTVVLMTAVAGLSASAALALWWPMRAPPAPSVPASPTGAVAPSPLPAPADVMTPASLAGLTASPIFYRSRAFVPVEDPEEIAASRPSYVLAAAMTLPKGRSVAYLRKPGEPTTVRVAVGDDLGGWTVRSIDVRRVVATRGTATAEFVPAIGAASTGLVRVAAGSAPPPAPGARVLGARGLLASNQGGRAVGREDARTYRPPPH